MAFNNTLIENGNFSPATTLTPAVAKYESFKKGWLVHCGMNTFHGHYASIVGTKVPAPPPTLFNLVNADVKSWATEAKRQGLDYAALTVRNEYGFLLYPSIATHNLPIIDNAGFTSPTYTQPYCVQPGYDQEIVSKFVSEFRAAGIEPVAYIGLSGDLNIANGEAYAVGFSSQREYLITTYFCKVIQEVLINFGFKYLWFDMAGPNIGLEECQRFYNAAKSIDPECMVIGNVAGESDFGRYPYDIQSTEEYAIYAGNEVFKNPYRMRAGITYYVGQEIVATPYGGMSQWYYYDNLCPVQPQVSPFDSSIPYVKMQAQEINQFQGIVQEARDYNLPFIGDMMINRRGLLVKEVLDYYKLINFFDGVVLPADLIAKKGVPTLVIATSDVDLTDAPFTKYNTASIYKLANPIERFVPGGKNNPFTTVLKNDKCVIVPLKDINLGGLFN